MGGEGEGERVGREWGALEGSMGITTRSRVIIEWQPN